jgi:S-layer protein
MPAQIFGSQATAVQLYVAFYGSSPSNPIYNNLVSTINTTSASSLAAQIGTGFSATSDAVLASTILTNIGITAGTTNQVAYDALLSALTQVFAAYPTSRGQVVLNLVNILTTLEGNATYGVAAAAWNNTTANAYTYASNTANTAPGPLTAGLSFVLSSGVDTANGSVGNDTINAGDIAGVAVWTTGDSINGGAGTDVFNVVSNGVITKPTAATVTGVETINLTSGSTVTLDSTAFTGLTALNSTSKGGATLTSAATTAISAMDSALVAGAIVVNGGSSVAVNAAGQTTGTITVGASAAAAAAVAVVTAGDYTDGANNAMGAVAVTGGTTVAVTVNSGITAAETTAAITDVSNFTETLSAVTVTGNASTTTVSVTQDKAVTAVNSTGTNGKVGVTNGAVTITDVNAASTTAAGVISTVTLNSFGASTVNSGALATLNLLGTGTSLTVTQGALTTANVKTQAVNVNGLTTTGTVTLGTPITTLDLASTTAASTIANLTAAGVTTLNVSGDAKVTLTDNSFAALTAVSVTNTAGFAMGTTALNTGATFTGGAGADAVVLGVATKAISMGAGDDRVTSGGLVGVGGSVNAGDGSDTIVMTSAQAAVADNDAVFNTKFTNFEVLELSNALAAATTLDLAGINGVSSVVLAAGGADAATSVISNLATNGTVTLKADSVGLVVNVDNAVFNAADVLNLNLSKSTVLAAGTVTAAGVETINITAADAVTTAVTSAAVVHTLTLVATGATTVNVSGNNGLNITNTGNTKITKFDASGIVANSTATVIDTPANLGVTFASANATASASVSITGSVGNDTLTGNAAADTINGGAGTDTITGGTGSDILTGGAGNDTFAFGTDGSVSGTHLDKITDFTAKTATAGDILTFGGATTVLAADTTALTAGGNVNTTAGGVVSFHANDTTYLLKVAAIQADAQLDAVGSVAIFVDGANTYVYYAGAAVGNADDQIIELTGVSGLATITGGATTVIA